jgi:gliding motility-associated-like protein
MKKPIVFTSMNRIAQHNQNRFSQIKTLVVFALLLGNVYSEAQENCLNGLDDDGDSLIDLNDTTDCNCNSNDYILSLIPNPSFEEYDCIPTMFSELYCAETWEQATYATSDFLLNIPEGFWDPLVPLPVPDGVGIGGFIISSYIESFGGDTPLMYNEYIGGCLLSPIQSGIDYTLQMALSGTSWDGTNSAGVFYGPIDITIYGSASCPTWPILVDPFGLDLGCPTSVGDWVELGHTSYTADETWQTITIEFTVTTEIQAIMIGGPCDVPEDFIVDYNVSAVSPYFFIDNMILNESSLFSSIESSGNICTDNFNLIGVSDSTSSYYQWYQEGVALTSQTNTILNWSELNLTPGAFQFVAFQNDSVCALSSVDVEIPTPILPIISANPQSGCEPLNVQFANINTPQSVNTTWSLSDGSILEGNDISITFNESGIYDVTVAATFDNGCTYDSTYSAYIEVFETPEATFGASPQPTTVNNTQITFTPTEDSGIVQWQWNFGSIDPFNAIASNPSVNFPEIPGAYPVELIVFNAQGCSDTSQSYIFIDASETATLPNVFSPNGDGYNDRFIPFEEYPGNWNLTIYNRWGTEIFTTNEIENGWSGSDAPAGTYYWIIVPLENQDDQNKSGQVTLIREK